jgi:hypothetical protein
MQSQAIAETIQACAQFCARSRVDCGIEAGSSPLAETAGPRKQAATSIPRRSGRPGLLFFQTLVPRLRREARLGRVKFEISKNKKPKAERA